MQIAKECDQLTLHLRPGVECHTAYGGSARAQALSKFLNGSPSILVATPGRLKDYLSEERVKARFSNLSTLILDEGDRMLDQGFMPDIKAILQLLPPKSTGWQGMCFSATLPEQIKGVLSTVLAKGYAQISTIDKNELPTHDRVPQYLVVIPNVKYTFVALSALIEQEWKEAGQDPKVIVFGTTANLVALFAEYFRKANSFGPVFELQSRMSQPMRTKTTEQFKKAKTGLMLATDVIGRGMDFPNVTTVIQVGLPENGEQYVHRVGRTARVDRDGRAVILLTEGETFFIKVNPKLPIKQYLHNLETTNDNGAAATVMAQIDPKTKQKAYSAYLGFMKGSMKKLRLDAPGLVALANEFAIEGFHCPEPPPMKKSTIGKMGLKGVKGIRYGEIEDDADDARPHKRPRAPGPQSFAPKSEMANVGRGQGTPGRGQSTGGRGGRGQGFGGRGQSNAGQVQGTRRNRGRGKGPDPFP